jgi:hypothetical protein
MRACASACQPRWTALEGITAPSEKSGKQRPHPCGHDRLEMKEAPACARARSRNYFFLDFFLAFFAFFAFFAMTASVVGVGESEV